MFRLATFYLVRFMFCNLYGSSGENLGPDRPETNWAECLEDDLTVIGATQGSTGSFPLVSEAATPTVAT